LNGSGGMRWPRKRQTQKPHSSASITTGYVKPTRGQPKSVLGFVFPELAQMHDVFVTTHPLPTGL
jgi:hypothetical protein